MAHYSILIQNGRVFDGKGNPMAAADIGVLGQTIEAIGELKQHSADRMIDANGKYVSPGFIDLTTHSDTHWTLFGQPSQESFIRQGVTTILGGNCGASLAPLVSGEDIEGIQRWADVRSLNINWQTFRELKSELSRHVFGVNFATLIGHGTLRKGVLGDVGRSASADEIRQMQFLLSRSFDEGAMGLSFNLGSTHEINAADEELLTLLNSVAKNNLLAKYHLEDEGRNILPALARVIGLARKTGARTQISHFKALGRSAWEIFEQASQMIEQARSEGIAVTADFFPYTRTGSSLVQFLPSWAIEGGNTRVLERLRDETQSREIAEALKSLTLHYDRITVASTLRDPGSVGQTVASLAETSGIDPEMVMIELLRNNELKVSIFNEVIQARDIEMLAGKEYAMISSDGVGYAADWRPVTDLPHPRSFGAFPTALSWLVRERNLLSWEAAIYKMTAFPAAMLGLTDRGILAKGMAADIVVFDPETVAHATAYEHPRQQTEGITSVILNGAIAFDGQMADKNFHGRLLLGGE